jgi:hypothetical protein
LQDLKEQKDKAERARHPILHYITRFTQVGKGLG